MASTRIFRSLSACIIALTGVLLATSVAAQSPAPLPNPNLNLLTNGTVYAIAGTMTFPVDASFRGSCYRESKR